MSCFYPLLAVDYGVSPETGKHKIKILPQRPDFNLEKARSKYGDSLMMLPCGHCVGCAMDYARTWQARIMCEAQYHKKKCFLTLKYRNQRLPNKEDLRNFIKAVRNKYGNGIKFFGCGELGSESKRFHCHLILFGVDFMEDAKIVSRRGENILYNSKIADDLWYHGFVSIGTLTVASAGYVSKYCNKKKITSQDDGEFVIMSRGLGRQYFEDHQKDIFNSDYLYFDGNKFKIPRYFFIRAFASSSFDVQGYAQDILNRKKAVATSFRYDSNRSVNVEEEGMKQAAEIKLDKLKQKEGYRDVY